MLKALGSRAVQASTLAGLTSLVLVAGAHLFQAAGLPPCEMCYWQRWPHYASAAGGLGAAGLALSGRLSPAGVRPFAIFAAAMLVVSGLIGIFHAGVEWDLWEGPTACAGIGYRPGQVGGDEFRIIRCDVAAWRLFGISLAGYNALISLAVAGFCATLLSRKA